MLTKKPVEKITILGVGNVLLTDEGLGVHMVHRLRRRYVFPEWVELVDGGTLGLDLLPLVMHTQRLLIVDAVQNGGRPGDIHVITGEQAPSHLKLKNSLHQSDLMEVLALSALTAEAPETMIIGMEPLDIASWGVDLTPPVKQNLEYMEQVVLQHLEQWGLKPKMRLVDDDCDLLDAVLFDDQKVE